jgi:hypothetical protein
MFAKANSAMSKKKGGEAAFFLRCIALLWAASSGLHAQPTAIADSLSAQAISAGLAQQPTWAALLHVTNGAAHIQGTDFLLSSADFSLENELVATIARLYGEPADAGAVCRFPARYLWLRSQVALPALPIEACAELKEFKLRAPADKIAVVFASENLARPASMMGHVFFKLSGVNDKQQSVRHAVSFITDVGGDNVAKLFFDSIVVGKNGFFTLGPYEEKLDRYLRDEQRTLWEYELALTPMQRDLLQAHLIELKQTRLTYFFQSYNCATVVDFILAVTAMQSSADVASARVPDSGFWITPKDVIKRLAARGLIKSSQVLPPNRWVIRAISEQLTKAERRQIQADVESNALATHGADTNAQFVRLHLAKAYAGYRAEFDPDSDSAQARAYRDALRRLEAEKFPGMRLETTSFKTPIATPQDSQAEFGMQRAGNQTFVRIGFTPASHHLSDDNRQYFAESELLLFDVSFLKDIASRKVVLDRFVLYSAKALLPNDAMSGGLSGAIRLGIAPQRDSHFRERYNAFIEGALGFTKRLGTDVDLFALAGAGLSGGRGGVNLYAQPEAGFVVREIFDLKTLASVQWAAQALGQGIVSRKYHFEQAKYFPGKNISLHLTGEWQQQQRFRAHFFELSARFLF